MHATQFHMCTLGKSVACETTWPLAQLPISQCIVLTLNAAIYAVKNINWHKTGTNQKLDAG